MTSVEEDSPVSNMQLQVMDSQSHQETSSTLDFLSKQLTECEHCGGPVGLLSCQQDTVIRNTDTLLRTPCANCGVVNALILLKQVFSKQEAANVIDTNTREDQTSRSSHVTVQHPMITCPKTPIVYASKGDQCHVINVDPQHNRATSMKFSNSVFIGNNTVPCSQLPNQEQSVGVGSNITEVLDILTNMSAGITGDVAPASIGVDTDDLIGACNIIDSQGGKTNRPQNASVLKGQDGPNGTSGNIYDNEHSYYTVRRKSKKQACKDKENSHLVMRVLPDGSITLLRKIVEDNKAIEAKVTYVLVKATGESGLDFHLEPILNPENPNSTTGSHKMESHSCARQNNSDLEEPLSRTGDIDENEHLKPNSIDQVKMAKIQDISFDQVGDDQSTGVRLGEPEVLLIVQGTDESVDNSIPATNNEQHQAIASRDFITIASRDLVPAAFVQIAPKRVTTKVLSLKAQKPEQDDIFPYKIFRNFQCDICNRSFPTHLQIETHYSSHINSKCYACKKCGKVFLTLASRASHHLSHRQEPLFCDICAEIFEERKHLTIHRRTHLKQKVYICNVCTKGFVSNYEMNQHHRIHFNVRDYKCLICGKSFKTRPALRKHSKNHLVENPFVCEVCKREFKHSYVFKEHQRTHTGEKPYQCELCGQTFVSGSNAARHIKNVHKDAALPILVKPIQHSSKNQGATIYCFPQTSVNIVG